MYLAIPQNYKLSEYPGNLVSQIKGQTQKKISFLNVKANGFLHRGSIEKDKGQEKRKVEVKDKKYKGQKKGRIKIKSGKKSNKEEIIK